METHVHFVSEALLKLKAALDWDSFALLRLYLGIVIRELVKESNLLKVSVVFLNSIPT